MFVCAAAMVLEAVSTMETVSSSLTRKMSEMRNSINERFDIVSMTLNGFLESCLRIQDKTPQLEETIGDVLWRIMDSVDNRFAHLPGKKTRTRNNTNFLYF